jgi:hypothetical protein
LRLETQKKKGKNADIFVENESTETPQKWLERTSEILKNVDIKMGDYAINCLAGYRFTAHYFKRHV